MSKIELVVFDWNGTVLNDEWVAVKAFERILHKIDHPEKHKALELHRAHFQIPVKNMYSSLGFSDQGAAIVAEEIWETVYENEIDEAKLQPGINEALTICKELGVKTAVLSNYTIPSITAQIHKRELDFDHVLANDSNAEAYNSGKQHRMEKFINNNSMNPTEIMIIGDSPEEYRIAKSVGANGYFITNGWVPEVRVPEIPSEFKLHSENLPALIKSLA